MINYSFSMVELEYYLLILCRVSCLIFIAPFYGTKGIPARVKVGLSIFVSLLIYQTVQERPVLEYKTVYGYAVLVLKEATAGLLMGYGCNICTTIISFAGRIMDMETGLSMASLMDPMTRENMSISGMLYQYGVLLLLMVSGMYQYIIKALVESYELIPVGQALFLPDRLFSVMMKFLADYILIGFRICLPLFAVMIILNAVLGILAKVAPQMNMFAVGIQIKVFVGLCVLLFTTILLPQVADMIYTEMKTMMVSFVEAMM